MRSENAKKFNHDDQADRYDAVVADESAPIRAGYRQALLWLGSNVPSRSRVLDLGSGTGNTILALPEDCHVTAVDVSAKMLAAAKSKLTARHVDYVSEDILEFFGRRLGGKYDAIVSSYAIHHLTDHEKELLFDHVHSSLRPTGRAVFVDLMYRNDVDRGALLEKYKNTPDVFESIQDEFFWDLDASVRKLSEIGFLVSARQFSDLSFGVILDVSPNKVTK